MRPFVKVDLPPPAWRANPPRIDRCAVPDQSKTGTAVQVMEVGIQSVSKDWELADQIAATAETLHQQAESLQAMVNLFKTTEALFS